MTSRRAETLYEVIARRRDVRNGFTLDPIPDDVLTRVLDAAHRAPSVGFSQPWDFLLLTDPVVRAEIRELVLAERDRYAAELPAARRAAFAKLKVEAILDTPLNIVVTSDPTRGGRYVLGRRAQPSMTAFSTACAVQNLWLAARAEDLGVGWVSFFAERELAELLGLPSHVEIVAYLCVGYVARFADEPELAAAGWARRRPLAWAVHDGRWGRRALPGSPPTTMLADARAAARRHSLAPDETGPAALAVFASGRASVGRVARILAGADELNAEAGRLGAELVVVDLGLDAEWEPVPGLLPRRVGSGNVDAAAEVGVELARDLATAGNRRLAVTTISRGPVERAAVDGFRLGAAAGASLIRRGP